MVRERLVLSLRAGFSAIWITLLILGGRALAQDKAPKAEPIDRKPYAIRMLIDFDFDARIDASRRDAILDDWYELVRRFVGPAWSPELVEDLGPLPAFPIEDLKAENLKGSAGNADKVWAIRVKSKGATLVMEGRELDVATGSLGEVHRREVTHPSDLARDLLQLTLSMFTPLAEVGESKAGGVSFLVQAGSMPSASSIGEVAPVGSIFRALRIFLNEDGSILKIDKVPYSYFRVERREGPIARCEILGGVRDPLTNRYARKNKLVALGIKPSSTPTRLRFKFKGDQQPAVGFRLIARTIPPGVKPLELGMTDREGRIVLGPGFAGGLVMLKLMAGNDEPMLEVPAMPGETPEERTIVFEPRPLTLALEAKLDALRDAIIDVVAVRARLEARMKARLDGEDWAGLDESIKEFRKLTSREQFETRLANIRDEGEHQEKEGNTIVLTRNARAQLDDTKAIIDRYLDDDAIRSYEDAAQRAKAELAKPKAAPKGAKKKS